MRVAIIHYTAPPVIGGVERVVAEQAKALIARGHDVTVFCNNADAHIKGVQVMECQRIVGAPCAAFHAVIVHNIFTMPFDHALTTRLVEMAVEQKATRWINWVHDVAALNPAYAHLPFHEQRHAMLRRAGERITHVAVSNLVRDLFCRATEIGIEQCAVIPNGIDENQILGLTDRVARFAKEHRFWDRDFILLHPARLVRRKNIELGLQVMASLREQGARPLLVITGAPDPHQPDSRAYFAELIALRQKLALEDFVVFAGEEDAPPDDDDVRALYRAADALFFPSKSEGFGLPLLEARLHGLQIFCSDIEVHRETLADDADSVFFDLDDPSPIAKRMLSWAAHDRRPRARREIIRKHFWFRICEEHLEPLLCGGYVPSIKS